MRIVRKAELEDSKIIAGYLSSAMQEIVHTFIGEKDPVKAREFILHFVEKEGNQYSHQNCWVLEEDARVVAAVNVYDGAQLVDLRQPVVDYIRSQFKKEFRIEDETQSGEHYIDSVGVDLQQQGKGAGTELLQFVIEEFVNNRKQTLGLLVDEENPNAKRLYLKLGFKRVGMKVLLGKNMEHLQIRA